MTGNACRNCHGFPETPYPVLDFPGFDLPFQGLNLLIQAKPEGECPEKTHWPEVLKVAQPQLQQLPFWVRSNYESTLRAAKEAKGEMALPFRINLRKAKFTALIKPKNFIADIFVKGKEIPLYVKARRDGSLHSDISLANNWIDLGLQNYLEGHGVEVGIRKALGLKVHAGFHLEKIALGPEGVFHLLGSPNKLLLQAIAFTDKIPFAPPEFRYRGDISCSLFHFQPQCRPDDPFGDIWLPDAVPPEMMVGEFAQLQTQWHLEELVGKILTALDRMRKETANRDPKEITEFGNMLVPYFFKPGTHLTLEIEDLKDFFIPGKVDLGPSHGRLQLRIDETNNLQLAFEDFLLRFHPMEFPFPQNDEKRGAFKIQEFEIRPGTSERIRVENIDTEKWGKLQPQFGGETIPPGLILTQDHETKNWNGTLNLDLRLKTREGKELQGRVLAKMELLHSGSKLSISPNLYLELRDFQVLNADGEAVLKKMNLVFDGPNLDLPFDRPPYKKYFANRAHWHGGWESPDGRKVLSQGHLDLPLKDRESLDWENFLHQVALVAMVKYENPEGRDINLRLDLASALVPGPQDSTLKTYSFGGNIAGWQLFPDASEPLPLLAPGKLDVQVGKNPEGTLRAGLSFTSPGFQWPRLKGEDLVFQGIRIAVKAPEILWQPDHRHVKISDFDISCNEDKSRGWITGPLQIQQKPGQNIEIDFKSDPKSLSVSGMDLKLNAQQIHLPQQVLHLFHPGTQGMGVDGRLKIDFDLVNSQTTDQWQGQGSILLAGDPQGDIYPLTADGRVNGVPLLRNSHWEWTKLTNINWTGKYLLGQGQVRTWINLSALRDVENMTTLEGDDTQNPAVPFNPSELGIELYYDNQPWSLEGFKNREGDYLLDACQKSDWCRELLR